MTRRTAWRATGLALAIGLGTVPLGDLWAGYRGGNALVVGPYSGLSFNAVSWGAAGDMNSCSERLGFKFTAPTTSPVSDVDWYMDVTGTVTGVNFNIRIETDSGDAPSGTVLGTATANFTGLAADGWTGLKALGTNTGNLTIGTPYWIVVSCASGTLDASNYVRTFYFDADIGEKIRHHNGTNWTTTAALAGESAVVVVKHADTTFSGTAVTSTAAVNASDAAVGATQIYSTNKQGLRVKFGSQVKLLGAIAAFNEPGTPGSLTLRVYEGSTEKASSPAYGEPQIYAGEPHVVMLSSPVLLAADTFIYVIFEQSGVSSSNTYDIQGGTFNSSYRDAALPTNVDFVWGSGADPTAYTVTNNFVPRMQLLLSDPATEFDEGGGSIWGF
jgi:hypothetical protein